MIVSVFVHTALTLVTEFSCSLKQKLFTSVSCIWQQLVQTYFKYFTATVWYISVITMSVRKAPRSS